MRRLKANGYDPPVLAAQPAGGVRDAVGRHHVEGSRCGGAASRASPGDRRSPASTSTRCASGPTVSVRRLESHRERIVDDAFGTAYGRLPSMWGSSSRRECQSASRLVYDEPIDGLDRVAGRAPRCVRRDVGRRNGQPRRRRATSRPGTRPRSACSAIPRRRDHRIALHRVVPRPRPRRRASDRRAR